MARVDMLLKDKSALLKAINQKLEELLKEIAKISQQQLKEPILKKDLNTMFAHLDNLSDFTNAIYKAASDESISYPGPKVTLLGACGDIGQPLALLLKTNPAIAKLALYDVVNTAGVAADLSHIDSKAQVTTYTGPGALANALKGADIIVISGGIPRKPGMTSDDLFDINAEIAHDFADVAAKFAPKAFVAIITDPVNSTVPIFSEIYKKHKVYDPKRIFGVTALDVVRAQAFVAESKQLDIAEVIVPVVGGHAGITIIPLLSQVKPSVQFSDDEIKNLTDRIQDAGLEVAKGGGGSATLSMSYAGARFINSLVKAFKGETVVECAYVKSDAVEGVDYFSAPIEIGKDGVQKILELGELSAYEQQLVDTSVPELQKSIDKGVEFVTGF